jgi:hypothetical protein
VTRYFDKNQLATSNDILKVSIGSIMGSRIKKIKVVFNGIIQNIWAKSSFQILTRNDQVVINMIHAGVGQA